MPGSALSFLAPCGRVGAAGNNPDFAVNGAAAAACAGRRRTRVTQIHAAAAQRAAITTYCTPYTKRACRYIGRENPGRKMEYRWNLAPFSLLTASFWRLAL